MVMSYVLRREISLNADRLHPETLEALKTAVRVAEAKTSTIAACAAAQAALRRIPGVPKDLHPLCDLADRCLQLRRDVLTDERTKAERSFGRLELRGRLVG